MEHDATTESTGPLAGLRVLDLSSSPAGGQASQTLADFGAEVVHVEPPGGSPLRDLPSFPMIGRGKKSMVLDLHDADDAALARAMALGADVLDRDLPSRRDGAPRTRLRGPVRRQPSDWSTGR